MRIALVGPAHPYKGGGARHTTELAHRLAAAGHEVIIMSWRAQYPRRLYPGRPTLDAPEGEPYPRTYLKLAWYRPDGWVAAGRRLRPADLVIFALLTPLQVPSYLAILAALGGQPGRPRTAVICHNVLPHERRPGDVTLMRALLSHADAVLVHSAGQADQARNLAPGVPIVTARMPPHLPAAVPAAPAADHDDHESERAVVLPPGQVPGHRSRGAQPAEPGPAEPGPANPGITPLTAVIPGFAVERVHDSPPNQRPSPDLPPKPGERPCRLLFFGIVRPYKGLDVLLRALARAPEHVTLTVAGEFWGGTGETEKLIAELGLVNRVALRPGYVPADQIPALFGAADALVLPYREATASQNVLLAFTYGVPVITTTAGALAEAVRDGVDGLTCAPGDVDELARPLTAISVPQTAARLRSGIRAFDPEPCWAAYLQALLARRDDPPGLPREGISG